MNPIKNLNLDCNLMALDCLSHFVSSCNSQFQFKKIQICDNFHIKKVTKVELLRAIIVVAETAKVECSVNSGNFLHKGHESGHRRLGNLGREQHI